MMRYQRVKDKRTGHRYDVLIEKFDPERHHKVDSGPLGGQSPYARRVQLNVKKAKEPTSPKPSGEPSGDSQENKEE